MKTVKHIIQNKSRVIYSVSPSCTVFDALKEMMEKNISALLIIEGTYLAGIFTEKDYARKIVLQGRSSKDTLIKDVMSTDLATIKMNSSVDQCMQIMTDKRIRHLPIIEDDKVAGMISIGDLVKFVIEDQKQTIEQLHNYISS